MNEIYMLMTVTKRSVGRRLLSCYEEIGLSSTLCTLAQGTATSETLDYFGLEVTEKMVTLTVVADQTWKQVKRELEDRFQIDVPGTGIAFLIPLSSVGGDIVTDAFGVVAMVAMTPLITIQILGLVFELHSRHLEKMEARKAAAAFARLPDDEIIEL